MRPIQKIFFLTGLLLIAQSALTQKASWRDTSRLVLPSLRYKLNASGTHYIKASVVSQLWARYSEMNPGTMIFDTPVNAYSDIGIRRLRFSVWAQVSDRIFFYTQFGQNNFNFLSRRQTGAFFHDAVTEFKIAPQLSLGGGLTGWSGLSRFASPAVGSIMGLDAPLYQQATNGVNDQFLRKLSIYAKGQIGKLDYRLAITSPMAVQNATAGLPVTLGQDANFSLGAPKMQTQGYLAWQFFDKEDNTLPYTAGTYLGKKKVLNIGAGFIHQPDAMWYLGNGDTLYTPMTLLGADAYLDVPVGTGGAAVSAYLAYTKFDFGPNHLRSFAPMNPSTGTNPDGTISGAGTAVPVYGTGDILYAQFGYKLRNNLLGEGTLMPYATAQYNSFERLDAPVIVLSGGVNWFIHGTHNAKMTLDYQSRPVMDFDNGDIVETKRKSMVVLQFQFAL